MLIVKWISFSWVEFTELRWGFSFLVSLRLVGKRKQSTPFLVTVLLLLVITPRLTAFNVAKSWNPGEEHHDFFWLFKVFRRDFRLLRNTAVTAPTSLGKRLPWLLLITISTCAARTRERKTCHTPPGARCAAAKAKRGAARAAPRWQHFAAESQKLTVPWFE